MSDISSLPWDESPSRVPSQPQSQSSWPEHVPIPKSFICPLSNRLMKRPVIDREGNSYERETILRHLRRPGGGFSPVTKNPLQESDLVTNKALMIAIDAVDCSLKYDIEEDRTNKQRASTKSPRVPRFRISNPISSSMKVAMQKVSTTFGQDTTNKRRDTKSFDVPTEDSLWTEVSESARDIVLDAIITKAEILPVVVSVPITSSTLHPQKQQTKHKAISSEITGSLPFTHKASSTRPHIVSQTSTAADRFEERLKKKLSNDPATRAKSKYEGSGKFDERLRKKLPDGQYFHPKHERGPRRSELRNGVHIDQEASADLKKHSHTTVIIDPVNIEGGSHSGPKKPAKCETIRSNTKYSFDPRNRSSDFSAVVKEDGYYAQIQEDRRRRWGHKQGEFVQRRKLSLTKSLKQAKPSIVPIERSAGTEKEHSRRQVDRSRVKLGGHKVIPNEPTRLPSVNKIDRSDKITIKDQGALDKLDKLEKKLRKKLSEDLAARTKYERKPRQLKSHREANTDSKRQSQTSMDSLKEEEDSPNSQNSSGKGDTVRPNYKYSFGTHNYSSKFEAVLEENTDDTQFQEERRRKWRGRRDKLDRRSNQTRIKSLNQAKASGIPTRYSTSNERRIGPERERRLIQFSSREACEMSELTFQESYSDLTHDKVAMGHHNESISSTRITENEEHGELSLAGKIAQNSQGNLPAQSRFCSDRSNRALSWTELSGEIVCAEFLSMKMTGSDALELQAELETRMLAEFELESYQSGESHEPVSSAPVRRPMVLRGGSRQEDVESLSLDTLDEKVGTLMEVVGGSDKTKFDVSNALEQAKGDMGYAMEILLQ